MRHRIIITLLAASCLLAGCGGYTIGPEDVAKLPRNVAKIWLPIERSPAEIHAAVPQAASEMGLSVEVEAGQGNSWILHRGSRIDYGPVFYRVDVDAIPGQPQQSAIAVYGVPEYTTIGDTGETLTKPQELAFRIATLVLGRPR